MQPHDIALVFIQHLSPRQALNLDVRTRGRCPASEIPAYEKTPILLILYNYEPSNLAKKR